MKKLVIAGRGDRLGARLKNALAAHHFAKSIGADFILAWDTVDHLDPAGIDFDELFDADSFLAATGITVIKENARAVALRFGAETPPEHIQGLSFEQIASLPDRVIWYSMAGPLRGVEATKQMAEDFNKWPLNQPVKSCLDRLLNVDGVVDGLAVHIRRGDIVSGITDPDGTYKGKRVKPEAATRNFVPRYAPIETYISAISEIYPSGNILVFSDDAAARSELADHFSDRSIRVEDVTYQSNLNPSQTALVEFCAINHCKKVIGGSSAFVQFAAELSGSEFHDIRTFLTPSVLLPDLQRLLSISKSKYKPETRQLLFEAYARYFKKEGRTDDCQSMISALDRPILNTTDRAQ